MVTKSGRIEMAVALEVVCAITRDFGDNVGAAETLREFCNGTRRGVAVDLNTSHDEIANRVRDSLASVVDSGPVCSAAIFGENTEDAGRELRGRRGLAEELVDILGLIGGRGGGRTEAEVKGKKKGAANSWNTVNNVSTVDRATVPGISQGVSSFNKYFVGAVFISGNGGSFIEEAMEFFDTDCFMVAFSSDV
jgi:hypothetical protein